jgi:hypothetical protein
MNPGTCIHFTGVQHKACKLGYVYDQLAKPLPCIHSYKKHFPKEQRGQQEPCKHTDCKDYLAPTAEQVAEADRRLKERLEYFSRAMGPVSEWRKAQGWSKKNRVSATGKVPCNACGKGEIHLSMAAYNGHVWGKCTTEGCVSWME